MKDKERSILIFGGSGFLGIHFANYLLTNKIFSKIIILDLVHPKDHRAYKFIEKFISNENIEYVYCDVRKKIVLPDFDKKFQISLIANFAAIHREPGHEANEYFETNILGSQNICKFAEEISCVDILFSSSISPYGVSKFMRNESSIPMPITPYGVSKLTAEWINTAWQNRDILSRQLLIIRPGVIFGPGEGGNVSRLIKMITKRRFFIYIGSPYIEKAGIYVKELCNAIWWLHEKNSRPKLMIANMTMFPCPTMHEYVKSIERVCAIQSFVPIVNEKIMIWISKLLPIIFRVVGIKTDINEVRIRKLINPNSIKPEVLLSEGYKFKYTMDEALRDWRSDMPEEWWR